jgi:putative phosphoribosyl transferase
MRPFENRSEAGRKLAPALRHLAARKPLVLALPRGGVPVAWEVARALHAPLDVLLVRKLGAPAFPELGIGAIVEGNPPQLVLNREVLDQLQVPRDWIDAQTQRELAKIERRRRLYRGERPPPAVAGRTVLLVDDGVATGGTVRAALEGLRRLRPERIVFAVPVGPAGTLEDLKRHADEVVCLATPDLFEAVGRHYRDFTQTTDDEVLQLLAAEPARPHERRELVLELGAATLAGDLILPAAARALVIFAHGSGSSRRSGRNRFVAEALARRGLATLLFDLLTEREDERHRARFDIDLLSQRLLEATDWAAEQPWATLPLAYFGASTGAAAALRAAASLDDRISAVVSRGGRPDLALAQLPRVQAPTLLIVGGNDRGVIDVNRQAQRELTQAPSHLVVVPGASHLFEEPGALEEVARLSGDWFLAHAGAVAMH